MSWKWPLYSFSNSLTTQACTWYTIRSSPMAEGAEARLDVHEQL